MKTIIITLTSLLLLAAAGIMAGEDDMDAKTVKTDAEWQQQLTSEQYRILRQKGTERAWTGEYNHVEGHGLFRCAACGHPLFSTGQKFDSGSGWPSYWKPYDEKSVTEITDESHGMVRTEVVCRRCGGHLGHVFNDGPRPTGLRYCINSAALKFDESRKQ